jgi:hypothetical protein
LHAGCSREQYVNYLTQPHDQNKTKIERLFKKKLFLKVSNGKKRWIIVTSFWVPNHLWVYTAILHIIRISLDQKIATKQCFKIFLKYTLSTVKHLQNCIQTFTSQENVHVFSRVSTKLKWLYVNRKIFQFHSLIVHF